MANKSPSTLQIDAAELIGFMIESVFFGVSLAFLLASSYLLLRKRRRAQGDGSTPISKAIMVTTSFLLTILVATHWAIDASRVYDGFISTQPEPLGSVIFFAHIANSRSVARIVVLVMEAVILDTLLVWRVWIICGRRYWIVVVPALCVVGTFVSGIGVAVDFSRTVQGQSVFIKPTGKWITTIFSLTLCTHIIAVCLVSYRITRTNHAIRTLGARSLWPILQIIIESSSITCALQILVLITYQMSLNIQWIPVAVLSPIIGVAFGLIIIRISLGVAGAEPVTFLHSNRSHVEATVPMEVVITRHVDHGHTDGKELESEDDTPWMGGCRYEVTKPPPARL